MNRPTAPASADLLQRLQALAPETLKGIRRGIEKESLRAKPDGSLALTPHPAALGSALTHPNITTDFSESQVELITGVHKSVEDSLAELREVHQFTYRTMADMGDEMLWVSSMPCGLPTDETIPIGRYGSSNVGRAKSVYRMGLGPPSGRRKQTI
jgi:glutamate--cysteine ligase